MIGLQDRLIFFRAVTNLSGHGGPSNLKVQFWTHLMLVKGYQGFQNFVCCLNYGRFSGFDHWGVAR